jgi:hypothetical protein
MKKSMENAFDLIKKGTVTIIHEDDLRLKLESGKKLKSSKYPFNFPLLFSFFFFRLQLLN